MPTLDMDVIFAEILPRLNAKSLNRFKCVSKLFQTVISSREFTKLYLRHQSRSSNGNELLILPGNRHIICYDLNSNHHSPIISPFLWYDGPISLVGSSNGLLCISIFDVNNRVSILNPYTHIYQYVPIPGNGHQGYNIGFAFDHENLDYKIVVVYDECLKTRVTKVYSLNTNSWSVVNIRSPVDSIQGRHGGALINSHLLHWLFWDSSMDGRIGCFDVCKMKWTNDVQLPRNFYDPYHQNDLLDFGVLDDKLFCSFKNGHGLNNSCFDVWVMNEYGVQDSWFKLLSIPYSELVRHGVIPVACRIGSGDILLRQRHSSRLLWYNTENGGITEAKFNGAPDFSELRVYTCSKSLIDLPRGKLFWWFEEFPCLLT